MKSRQVPGWVRLILIIIHVLTMGLSLHGGSWMFPDSDRYQQAAANMRSHAVLYARPLVGEKPSGKDVQEFTIRPPGYPLMLVALKGDQWPIGVLIAQNVLSLAAILLLLKWWAGRGEIKPKSWGASLLLVLSFPGQFIYANALMSEILMQSLVVAMASLALLFVATRLNRYFLGCCIALSLGLLVKPVLFPLAAVAATLGTGLAWQSRRLSTALIGLLPVLVVCVYMSWNEKRTGYFHFSSIAEINVLHYNAAGVVRQTLGPKAEENWVASVLREADAQPTFAARQKLIEAKAIAVLAAHPVPYALQHLAGMATFFLDPGRFDISQFFRLPTPASGGLLNQVRSRGVVQALGSLPLAMLATLGLITVANLMRLLLAVRGFVLLGKASVPWRQGRWLVLGIILYVALLTGPLGAARFMVPVWPLLLGLALVGLISPVRQKDSEAKKTAVVGENQTQSSTEYGSG